jgi:hypothetical protein
MVETVNHSCLILDVKKETNGRNIDPDQTELAHFVGRFSNEGTGFSSQIEMDLGVEKELVT